MSAVNFISYLRVSTQAQGATGLGIEAQREAVERYVTGIGGTLLAEHVEVETGRSATRPILLKSIAQCRREKAILVIARLDRLARSVSFISSLMEARVDFVACDFPAANKMVLQMLAVFAEFERDQIAARTKAALAAAKARGVLLGVNGRKLAAANVSSANDFAERLREAAQASLNSGSSTLREIADDLNRSGARTREQSCWSPPSVHRLLRRLDLATPYMSAQAGSGTVDPL